MNTPKTKAELDRAEMIRSGAFLFLLLVGLIFLLGPAQSFGTPCETVTVRQTVDKAWEQSYVVTRAYYVTFRDEDHTYRITKEQYDRITRNLIVLVDFRCGELVDIVPALGDPFIPPFARSPQDIMMITPNSTVN